MLQFHRLVHRNAAIIFHTIVITHVKTFLVSWWLIVHPSENSLAEALSSGVEHFC